MDRGAGLGGAHGSGVGLIPKQGAGQRRLGSRADERPHFVGDGLHLFFELL